MDRLMCTIVAALCVNFVWMTVMAFLVKELDEKFEAMLRVFEQSQKIIKETGEACEGYVKNANAIVKSTETNKKFALNCIQNARRLQNEIREKYEVKDGNEKN